MFPIEATLDRGGQLVIREVIVPDAAAVLDYVEIISGESEFLTFGPGEHGFTVDSEETFIRDAASADNCLFLMGEVDGVLVGLLHFSGGSRPRLQHCGEFGMSVLKAWWGRGVGSGLLDALIAWARDRGIVTKINLRVRTDNHRAMGLYVRKGFVTEGTIHREMRIDGRYYDHYWMGLAL